MTALNLADTIAWMNAGTEIFLNQAHQFDAGELCEPSLLPTWTRAIVIAHVARNADALGRLLAWARTGTETSMYASASAREDEIAASSQQPRQELCTDLTDSARQLHAAISAMEPDDWNALVRTATGRTVPASAVPWLRTREVWLHAVDVKGRTVMSDIPPALVDALMDEVVSTFETKAPDLHLLLTPTDRPRTWRIGDEDRVGASVAGPAGSILGWLLGRDSGERLTTSGQAGELPALPAWL